MNKTTKINTYLSNALTTLGQTVVITQKALQKSPYVKYTYQRPVKPAKPKPRLSQKIDVCTVLHHHREK